MLSASFFSDKPGRDVRKLRRQLPQILRRGTALLHQQCWLWGCDIRHSEGNLLLAYGFARQADPEGKRSTQYTLSLQDLSIVRLWGAGLYFGDAEEGVFLNRFAFEPRLVRFTEDWQDPARLKEAPRYLDFQCLSAACDWIAAYETWALLQLGNAYRRTCLSSGPDPAQEPECIAAAWQQLAEELAAFC